MDRTKKRSVIILSISCVLIFIAAGVCFLLIPRKTNSPLLPVTIEAMEKYPSFVSGGSRVVPRKSLIVYLDENINNGGENNEYEKKYRRLYETKGLYVELTDEECLELVISGGSYNDVMKTWEQCRYNAWQVFLDEDGNFNLTSGGSAGELVPLPRAVQ